jgi:hypothetical protein
MGSVDKRSEKEKMLAGDLYYSFGDELFQERQRAKELLHKYNQLHQVLPYVTVECCHMSHHTVAVHAVVEHAKQKSFQLPCPTYSKPPELLHP